MTEKSIVLTGVGGQGVLIIAKILGNVAMEAGLEVLQSEVHGMAQRGGVVESMIKIGDNITSPLVANAAADILMGFEPLETYRAMHFINRNTTVVTSVEPIYPFTVSIGKQKYPDKDKMLSAVRNTAGKVYEIENVKLANEVGNPVTANVVMLGALTGTGTLGIEAQLILEVMKANVPKKFIDMNDKAFNLGMASIKK